MIAAVDVGYHGQGARAAVVLFEDWRSSAVDRHHVVEIERVADYQPGEFYRRELPCIERVLAGISEPIRTIVIDGYVFLDAQRKPGLGARLWEALGERTPVIGVAKTAFVGVPDSARLTRGGSQRALFVTAVGIEEAEAREHIAAMSGAHRIPDFLKLVDQLSRE